MQGGPGDLIPASSTVTRQAPPSRCAYNKTHPIRSEPGKQPAFVQCQSTHSENSNNPNYNCSQPPQPEPQHNKPSIPGTRTDPRSNRRTRPCGAAEGGWGHSSLLHNCPLEHHTQPNSQHLQNNSHSHAQVPTRSRAIRPANPIHTLASKASHSQPTYHPLPQVESLRHTSRLLGPGSWEAGRSH